MNRKFLWFFVFMFIILGSFAAASADQDGRNCWCNIDDYGCRITDEDGGAIYIMFWSEEARQYIMGAGSPPYKFVVRHPGDIGRLTIECGISKPDAAVIPPFTLPVNDDKPSADDVDERSCHEKCMDTESCNIIKDEIDKLVEKNNIEGSLSGEDTLLLTFYMEDYEYCLQKCKTQCGE